MYPPFEERVHAKALPKIKSALNLSTFSRKTRVRCAVTGLLVREGKSHETVRAARCHVPALPPSHFVRDEAAAAPDAGRVVRPDIRYGVIDAFARQYDAPGKTAPVLVADVPGGNGVLGIRAL